LVVSEVKMLFHLLPFGGEWSEDVISLVTFWWRVKWRCYFTCYIFGGVWSEDVISLVTF
jgi:hypothetical protein